MDPMDLDIDMMFFELFPLQDVFQDLEIQEFDQTPLVGNASRKQGPRPEEWEAIRPMFLQLYSDEGKKLEEVMKILADKHGFHASPHMYKRRVRKWLAHKNYKTTEKELILNNLVRNPASGLVEPQKLLHGRPVKYDRIQRYCRLKERSRRMQLPQERKLAREINPSSAVSRLGRGDGNIRVSESAVSKNLCQIAHGHQVDRKQALSGHMTILSRISDPYSEFEQLLWNIKAYYTFVTEQSLFQLLCGAIDFERSDGPGVENDPKFRYLDSLSMLFEDGATAFQLGQQQLAWRKFDKVCEAIKNCINNRELWFPTQLMRLASRKRTADLFNIQKHILEFAVALATTQQHLGAQVPLVSILRYICKYRLSIDETEVADKIMMDEAAGCFRIPFPPKVAVDGLKNLEHFLATNKTSRRRFFFFIRCIEYGALAYSSDIFHDM